MVSIIDKSPVGSELSFPADDVHDNSVIKRYRLYSLLRAERFSNLYRKPVEISYRTADRHLHFTRAVVWSVGDEWVVLQGHPSIPIQAIIGVDI